MQSEAAQQVEAFVTALKEITPPRTRSLVAQLYHATRIRPQTDLFEHTPNQEVNGNAQ